ncbi:MAG: septation protein SpoVG family protein [Planctomycetota bacterium]
MDITEVRIKLMEESDDRLQAFCSITIDDCFVIRDLKIIEGSNGPFVAMPSRKLTSHCPQCGMKNHLRSLYCNQCGIRLKEDRTIRDQDGRAKLYADVAHPINSQCREMIQKHVIDEFRAELQRAAEPDYVSRYDEDYEDSHEDSSWEVQPVSEQPRAERALGQHSHVEPAAREPRPPHQLPSSMPDRRSSSQDEDQFGAGIFD